MTLSELLSDIDFLASTNTAKYPTADKVRNINLRYSAVVALIIRSDGRWQWDDDNHRDGDDLTSPIAVGDLEEGVQDYEINGLSFLTLSGVQIKNKQGNYITLTPASYNDDAQALAEMEARTGMPERYVKRGSSVFLFPKPSSAYVTLTDGIKVLHQRPPDYFETSETTKSPGFNPLFHRILSVGAALDYAIANGITKKIQILTPMLEKLETGLADAYTRRSRDEQPRLTLATDSFSEIY